MHIVCYSGGHSSALVAIEVVRRFGKDNVILLNHDINSSVEAEDVKRFKAEVAEYLGLKVTFANIGGLPVEEIPDQFDVCIKSKAFKVGTGTELCTSRLKTEPFMAWLKRHHPEKDCIIYYGFDANETNRIQRRSSIMGLNGYATDYPLALWAERTIGQTIEIGINPPMQYESFKHANCVGCLKAGRQHWYVVYCTRPDIFTKAKETESIIGYSIIAGEYLEDLEAVFEDMKRNHIPATEHINSNEFWAGVRRAGIDTDTDESRIPCECIF